MKFKDYIPKSLFEKKLLDLIDGAKINVAPNRKPPGDFESIPVGPQTVAVTVFGGRLISTVKTSKTHFIFGIGFDYETLVFDREGQVVDAAHYLTRDAAFAEHWNACRVHFESQ